MKRNPPTPLQVAMREVFDLWCAQNGIKAKLHKVVDDKSLTLPQRTWIAAYCVLLVMNEMAEDGAWDEVEE